MGFRPKSDVASTTNRVHKLSERVPVFRSLFRCFFSEIDNSVISPYILNPEISLPWCQCFFLGHLPFIAFLSMKPYDLLVVSSLFLFFLHSCRLILHLHFAFSFKYHLSSISLPLLLPSDTTPPRSYCVENPSEPSEVPRLRSIPVTSHTGSLGYKNPNQSPRSP